MPPRCRPPRRQRHRRRRRCIRRNRHRDRLQRRSRSWAKPVTDETFPVEITGVAEDPDASRKAVDPTAGFSVLSRVRFSKERQHAFASGACRARRVGGAAVVVARAGFGSRDSAARSGAIPVEARRLSLTRALAIRTYLVSKGVPIERVDVLAFGGPAQGVTDRVDVLVRRDLATFALTRLLSCATKHTTPHELRCSVCARGV